MDPELADPGPLGATGEVGSIDQGRAAGLLPDARPCHGGGDGQGLAGRRRRAAGQVAAFHRGRSLYGAAGRHGTAGGRDQLRATLMALICDTGPLYAAMDRADADHQACAELLADSPERLFVPAPVIVELDWLAYKRLGPQPFSAFLADVEDEAIIVVDLVH